MATITVQPNQSMLDVIIQAMGTLEGGMCFCALNNVAISDTPAVGTVYTIPDGSQSTLVAFDSSVMIDNGVLQFLSQNEIVLGNLALVMEALQDNDGAALEDNDGQSLFDNGN
jgi:hypothetical protein